MDNSKNKNIYIVDIDAENLANPNWNINTKYVALKSQYILLAKLIEGHLETNEEGEFTNEMLVAARALADEYSSNIKANPMTDPYEIKEENRDLLYRGSVPVSLDILKLQKLYPKEFYTRIKKTKKVYKGDIFNIEVEKLYTDAIINVTFDRASYEMVDELGITNPKRGYKGKINMDSRVLREKFYKDGFTLKFGETLVEYVKYKRSSSKAREGSHLFIKRELKEAMNDWHNFGIEFKDGEENVPLTAIKAYEGLTSSGIEKTIKIYPHEILLIDDYEAPVTIQASITKLKNGNIIAENDDKYPTKNIVWDGQSLLDTSLFDDKKGMMLLRNSFFKSCGFNTNIQQWFDDAFGDNKPEYIKDMFGRDVKLSDIKLITTPSSIKFLKFVDKFNGSKQECYERWLASISEVFGVCKSEKSSPFGEFHQLSYQIVNSLPLSKDEIGTITKNPDKSYSYGGLL